ncbi:hypothetical protein GQ44DRAFT_778171 [Phaeosphaeriaceae sp. PMI808]|nr:hypothetical protein GQ44DRAFT_778171 [Phaeosphaeriaceae sp. PMI808]
MHPLYYLVNDEALFVVVPLDPNVLLVPGRDDGRSILVDIELVGRNTAQSIKILEPHERPIESKAENEAAAVLSGKHLPRISP